MTKPYSRVTPIAGLTRNPNAVQCSIIARRWFEEIWNREREETIFELMAPDAIGHMEGHDVRGPEGFRDAYREMKAIFPDLRVVVEDTVTEFNQVVVRWRAEGTYAANKRAVSFRGMTWMIFDQGKLVEGWDVWNQGALMESLV